jgi:hypothetical protein
MVAEVSAPLLSPAKDGGEEKERVAMVGLARVWVAARGARRIATEGKSRGRGWWVGWRSCGLSNGEAAYL